MFYLIVRESRGKWEMGNGKWVRGPGSGVREGRFGAARGNEIECIKYLFPFPSLLASTQYVPRFPLGGCRGNLGFP